MNFTQSQKYEILEEIVQKEDGLIKYLHTFWDTTIL